MTRDDRIVRVSLHEAYGVGDVAFGEKACSWHYSGRKYRKVEVRVSADCLTADMLSNLAR
jgi:hypothetical protein